VNVAEPYVLCVRAPQRIEGVLSAPPDQRLAAADPCARHPEVPKEELEQFTPTLKALVKLLDLLGERLLKSLLVADHLSFAWIGKDRDSSPAQLDELRLVPFVLCLAVVATRQ